MMFTYPEKSSVMVGIFSADFFLSLNEIYMSAEREKNG
jgi:hypothetical protein